MTRPAASSRPIIFGSFADYRQGDQRNATRVKYDPSNFINAALAGIGDGKMAAARSGRSSTPEAVAREGWDPSPPHVDIAAGFFFSADTVEELAAKIVMKYQRVPDAAAKPRRDHRPLQHALLRPALTPTSASQSRAIKSKRRPSMPPGRRRSFMTPAPGLRINARCQVLDINGAAIPGLYCGGESAGGLSLHGLPRAICQGCHRRAEARSVRNVGLRPRKTAAAAQDRRPPVALGAQLR